RLLEAGAKVDIVAPEAGKTYPGKGGTTATSTLAAKNAAPSNYDGLVIPGGFAPDFMRRHEAMVSLVREMFSQNNVVASICHGGWMLASAKILNNRKVTSFFAIKDDLIHAGANWVNEEVVVDSNLITSRTPDDLPAFMRAVISALGEK
ncbi:MAG: type 1 glutamine amidotransferase domain-containing protein, partial [Desulfonatronovibrionaceae bacterium]